jgi:uncharacterized membrane protein
MSMQFNVTKHRMEALIDGVFAVALTILVLEIKVPELADPRSGSELMHALGHHLSTIVAYFLSFAMLGLFWVWHHQLSHKVREIDGAMMSCSLAFLALVSFYPFAAALFSRYIFSGNVSVLLVFLPTIGLIPGAGRRHARRNAARPPQQSVRQRLLHAVGHSRRAAARHRRGDRLLHRGRAFLLGHLPRAPGIGCNIGVRPQLNFN